MKQKNTKKIKDIIAITNQRIIGIDYVAQIEEEGTYEGIIRAAKGKLLEAFCQELVYIAWDELGGKREKIECLHKKVEIPLKRNYLDRIKVPEIKQWIMDNYADFTFPAQVDVEVWVNQELVIGIECKSYTENSMLKRILFDFALLKSQYENMKCGLIQFESSLGGDYSDIDKNITMGSRSTHTLLSFSDIDLEIMTLIKGERNSNQPIHKQEYFKPLTEKHTKAVVERIKKMLSEFK